MQDVMMMILVVVAAIYIARYLLRSGRSFVKLCRSKGTCDSCSCGKKTE